MAMGPLPVVLAVGSARGGSCMSGRFVANHLASAVSFADVSTSVGSEFWAWAPQPKWLI